MLTANRNRIKKVVLSFAVILLMLLLPSYATTPNQVSAQATALDQGQPTPYPAGPTPTPLPADKWNLWLKSHLIDFSPSVANSLAKGLGVTALLGKPINQRGSVVTPKPKLPNGLNTPIIGGAYDVMMNPSIAFNPVDARYGYAVFEEPSAGQCNVYDTTTGGSAWFHMGFLPLNVGGISCADPVVRWSPDGSTAYFVYLSLKAGTNDLNVLVDGCPPFGCTVKNILWSGTAGTDIMDSPWVDVHQMDNAIVSTQGAPSQANYVYVSFTYFDSVGHDLVDVRSSANHGGAWGPFTLKAGGTTCTGINVGCNPLLTGGRVIGGMYNMISGHGDVLACWYNSDTDWEWGVFDIQCSHSPTNGATWFGAVNVAHNVKYELPAFLCPNGNYEAWWTGMFPSIAISPDGRAHIAFAASSYDDGLPSVNKVNCGDIRYVRSKPFDYDNLVGPSYKSWLPVVTVAGGGLAQGFPTLVAQVRPAFPPTSLGYRLYLFYYDAKNSPTTCTTPLATKCYANILYDIYMRTSNNGGTSFSSDVRITDQSSLANYDDVTSYIDATATSHSVWVIWPDRAGQLPCPIGVSGCPTGPPPIHHFDTYSAIYAQQVSST